MTKGIRSFIVSRRIHRNWQFYLMLAPVIAFFAVFCYGPMYGITLAFKDYKVMKGIMGSPWTSPWYNYLQQFFESPYFFRVLINTVALSLQTLLLGFPLPILLALSLNEVRSARYKRFVQNVTYAPHFLSVLVLVGVIKSFTNSDYGVVNLLIRQWGGRSLQLDAVVGPVPSPIRRLRYLAEYWMGFHYLHCGLVRH